MIVCCFINGFKFTAYANKTIRRRYLFRVLNNKDSNLKNIPAGSVVILLLVREVIHILEVHLLSINVCSLLIKNNANREMNSTTI